MMDPLVIGIAQRPDPLRERLERELADYAPLAAALGLSPPQVVEHRREGWCFLAVHGPVPPQRQREPRERDPVPGLVGGGIPSAAAPSLSTGRHPAWWSVLAGLAGEMGSFRAEGGLAPPQSPGAPRQAQAGRPAPTGPAAPARTGPTAAAAPADGSDASPATAPADGRGDAAPPTAPADGRGGPRPPRAARDPGRSQGVGDDAAAPAASPGGASRGTRGRARSPGAAAAADIATGDAMAPLQRDWEARVVRAVVAYVHEDHRWLLVQRFLKRRYAHLAPDERLEVVDAVRRRMAAAAARDARLRHLLTRRVAEYVQGARLLLIDGFLRFRCREYVEALELAADRAVDEYLLDREYREFVQLLRQFVDLQVPRLSVVHVLVEPSGSFILTDEAGRPLAAPTGEGPVPNAGPGVAADAGDALLSALVMVGARRFVVHVRRRARGLSRETRELLDQVFGDRVELCPGCARCRSRARRPAAPAPGSR